MDDLIKGIKAQLYDRLSSPLFFTFAISLLAWNYRPALIFVSSLSPQDKFLALDLLSLTWEREQLYWLSHLLFFPLATTAFYIFVLPWAEKIVFEYTLERKKDLKLARQKIEDETPVSNEEARELRSLAEAVYKEHDAIIKSRQEEIARLKLEVADLRGKLNQAPESSVKAVTPLEDVTATQAEMLQKISTFGGIDVSKYVLFKDAPEARLKVQYDIDELVRRNYILEHNAADEDNGDMYDAVTLTALGRRFLVENLSADLV